MRTVPIDIDELEMVLECMGGEDTTYDDAPIAAFLNLTTGKFEWADCDEEADEHSENPEMLELPEGIYEGWDRGALDQFVSSLPESPLHHELAEAIRGPGAFRRFKDIVFGGGNVELKHRWSWFETRIKRERITEWFESCKIEPRWNRDIFQPPPLPEKRSDLLRAVRTFVIEARDLVGVRRIGLLGSLTTSKAIPKDVDLLVEVSDDMPLGKLARLKRQLLGKTMQTGDGCGADVFLCNSRGEYLGRICSWKKCGPGTRQSCPAQNCGRRKFLNDDLQIVRLDSSLVMAPPLELWPAVIERVKLPKDVQDELIAALQ